MSIQASRWSAILFAPARSYRALPVGIPTGDRVYQAQPIDRFEPLKPTAPVAKSAAVQTHASEPVKAREVSRVTVRRGDVLAIEAQAGDYYWKLARRFAKDDAIGAYARELMARHGASSVVKPGQLLNLPVTENADDELELAVAVQKVVQLRSLFGERFPRLDWGSVEVSPGPVDATWVSFREIGSTGTRQRFMVSEDMSGLNPGSYHVMTEREARFYFPD